MSQRLVEDLLHDEYYKILPNLNLARVNLEINIKHIFLSIINDLQSFERIEFHSRVKNVESAIEKLKSKQDGKMFIQDPSNKYSLLELRDLVGIRILFFPYSLEKRILNCIQKKYSLWEKDFVTKFNSESEIMIYKYFGKIEAIEGLTCELQIMPLLFSRFLDVEHDVIYKPDPKYKGIERSLEMRKQKTKVLDQLKEFEMQFINLIKQSELN